MCGIAGIFGNASQEPQIIRAMSDAVAHRGPDDEGAWADAEAGIALGHRRLSIIDLSPAGHQPMRSENGRYVVTFNGEIYNHLELRSALEAEGAVPQDGWRGHSDTEVFLEGIANWGLKATLERSVGMFAFGLWDREQRVLSLVRDRFGEKPLYYGWAGRDLVFASEIKALRAHPGFDNAIDPRAVRLFASRSYVPAPYSIYKGVFKLPPGCILRITPEGACTPRDKAPEDGAASQGVHLTHYWSYREVVLGGLANPIEDEMQALHQLEQALANSIHSQSVADVPVGAFLSGGIDSSTIVALYQMHASVPVRTYSIGFAETGYNEAEDAKAVARHLGTIHHEHYVSAREALEVIPLLPSMYDEPFADSSQIPTYLVSRFASQEVKVVLTGDGGDELLAGYNRHVTAPRMWSRLQRVPRPLRALGLPLSHVPSRFWKHVGALAPGRRQPHFGGKLQKAFSVAASAASVEDVYRHFLDEWSVGTPAVRGDEAAGLTFELDLAEGAPDAVRMMYRDAVSYLPGDILCKVDRASMAVSLETRVPFLDHRVAAVAARVPLAMKTGDGQGKLILRKLLDRHVPRALVDRPKAGFQVPVGEWIKGPLRGWAEELLEPHRLRADGWFDADVIASRWRGHLRGSRDSTVALWSILMFQAWLREQIY